jgi:hypothetical protein
VDYSRVYSEFISDRQGKPTPEPSERHHILPRQVGGSDDSENLIRLSSADHFFAHLLLAKIYGGRLWAPVILWCGGDKGNWRARKSRLNYAWAARAAVKRLRGKGAWQYDRTVHYLQHKDGRAVSATQFDLLQFVGGVRSGINLLLKRKVGHYRGWFLAGHPPVWFRRGSRPGLLHAMADRKVYRWVHVSGDEFVGTRVEFCETTGVSKKSACLIANKKQVISKGWTLHGATIPRTGGASHLSQTQTQSRRPQHRVVREVPTNS